MRNEKPGGHGERSVAVGTIDMAVWDAVAKIAGKPLFRLLAERHGREPDPRVFVYAAGGYYSPDKDLDALRARDARLRRPRVHRRQDEDRRPASTRTAAHRGRALRARRATRSSPWTRTAASTSTRDRVRAHAPRRIRSSGTRRPAIRSTSRCRRRWPRSIPGRWRRGRTSSATRTRATCCATAACARIATGCSSTARSRTACASTSARSPCCASEAGRRALHPARRAPDVAPHRGRARPRRQRGLSRPLPALRRLPGRRARRGRPRHPARAPGDRLRGQGRPHRRDAPLAE